MYTINEDEVQAVRRVVEKGQLFRYLGGEGGETDQFEREWAEKIEVSHALMVTSGTAALICGLVGLDIGPGDEVIVPAYTFIASALAPLAVGAVPVIVEVDESLTIDPNDVERKITSRTKAIMPVHMFGLPCNMEEVMRIAHKYGLAVIEDACQADGGSYRGKRLGSIGNVGAFSFNQFKIISCGEGGAMVTNDRTVYQRAVIHHDAGCVFWNAEEMTVPFFAGWNFRSNEISSAIMRVQLARLEGILAALREDKRLLGEQLANETSLAFNPINDPEGDCGTGLMIYFQTKEQAELFKASAKQEGLGLSTLIESGRHVYSNWDPVINKCGASHPGRDAYKLAKAPIEYSPDMCPKTSDILARTIPIGTSITRSADERKAFVEVLKQAEQRCR